MRTIMEMRVRSLGQTLLDCFLWGMFSSAVLCNCKKMVPCRYLEGTGDRQMHLLVRKCVLIGSQDPRRACIICCCHHHHHPQPHFPGDLTPVETHEGLSWSLHCFCQPCCHTSPSHGTLCLRNGSHAAQSPLNTAGFYCKLHKKAIREQKTG